MTENPETNVERPMQLNRRWQLVGICTISGILLVQTVALFSLRSKIERSQRAAELAFQAARTAKQMAEKNHFAIENLKVDRADANQAFLFPTEQMYRRLPDEELDSLRRLRNVFTDPIGL